MADIDEQLPSLPVGLFMADPDGRITAANEAFGALVHGPLGSVLGGPPWADAHPGDRASAELAWRRGVEAGGDISLSFRVWHGEGRMLWVRIDAAPRRDLDNRLVGFSGTALDSTDAVAGEQLLDRLAAVAGAADDAILILDRNGAPVFTNAAARELFGVEQEVDLIRDPSARGLLQAIRDQVPREIMSSSESTVWSGEVGFRGPDGLERTLDVDLLLHRSAEGIIEYWGGVAKDITATKHLQSELTRQANHDPLTGLPNRLMLLRTAAGWRGVMPVASTMSS